LFRGCQRHVARAARSGDDHRPDAHGRRGLFRRVRRVDRGGSGDLGRPGRRERAAPPIGPSGGLPPALSRLGARAGARACCWPSRLARRAAASQGIAGTGAGFRRSAGQRSSARPSHPAAVGRGIAGTGARSCRSATGRGFRRSRSGQRSSDSAGEHACAASPVASAGPSAASPVASAGPSAASPVASAGPNAAGHIPTHRGAVTGRGDLAATAQPGFARPAHGRCTPRWTFLPLSPNEHPDERYLRGSGEPSGVAGTLGRCSSAMAC
jgi:hypothetical protein